MSLIPASWADVPLTSLSLLGPLALFALVSSITPGPNNVMLATSGLNFGFRRTIPHLLGVSIGFTLMVFLVGVGLGSVFQQVPALYTVLKYAGAAYLLYLAWKIANAGEMKDGVSRARPMTFLQAAAFQWVNPKAWVMAVGIIATYTPPSFFANLHSHRGLRTGQPAQRRRLGHLRHRVAPRLAQARRDSCLQRLHGAAAGGLAVSGGAGPAALKLVNRPAGRPPRPA